MPGPLDVTVCFRGEKSFTERSTATRNSSGKFTS